MEMASAEDTILQKLKWFRMGKIEKHLVDAAFVYQIQFVAKSVPVTVIKSRVS